MSQFWDTYTPECNDCKSYERDLTRAKKRVAELEFRLAAADTALQQSASLNADLDNQLATAQAENKRLASTLELARSAMRQGAERITQLEVLCERSYKFLGYWFSSLKGDGLKLWQDLHAALHMEAKEHTKLDIKE